VVVEVAFIRSIFFDDALLSFGLYNETVSGEIGAYLAGW
jgi:hypothetical protein